jgi:methyl-accepting chemotaxis protein
LNVLRHLNIGKKIALIVGIFTLSLCMILAYTYYGLSQQQADSTVINDAGRQRMLTQRMSKNLEAVYNGDMEQLDKLREDMHLFDDVLEGLIKGDKERGYPPAATETIRTRLAEVQKKWTPFQQHLNQFIESYEKQGQTQQRKKAVQYVRENNVDLLATMNQAVGALENHSRSKLQAMIRYQSLLAALALLLGIGLSWFIIRRITTPLRKVCSRIAEIARGNISQDPLRLDLDDEIGDLSRDFNRMLDSLKSLSQQAQAIGDGRLGQGEIAFDEDSELAQAFEAMEENLRDLITRLSETAAETANTSAEVLSASEELEQVSDNQAEELDSSSSAVHELSQSVEEIAKNAEEGQNLAEKTLEQAQAGSQSVSEVIRSMDTIRDHVNSVDEEIEQLSSAGDEINTIVDVISEIAEQTSLLALNAAIEAERAGEEGQGFAVVAEEVSDLAEQVQSSVNEIETIVRDIQTRTEQSAEAMQKTTREVKEGVEVAQDAGEALDSILDAVDQTKLAIDSIASGLRQQTSASNEVANSIEQINNSSRDVADSADHLVQEGEQLDELSDEVQTVLDNFQVNGHKA